MVPTETAEEKKKRAAKRYPYSCAARCEFGTQNMDVQILNISTSGVQFATRTKIETKLAIRIIWSDSKFGKFDPTFWIAREIHKPEDKEFQYYYGAQYYNLTPEMKKTLLVLLMHFSEESKREAQQQVEKITPQYIFDVIDQGSSFLKKALVGGEVAAYFDAFIRSIKYYEKIAFELEDEVSKCIQKLTTFNFHCTLFNMLVPSIIEKKEWQSLFFQHIRSELLKIEDAENQAEIVSKKVMQGVVKEDDSKAIQKRINESNNRLFYTKQGLLQAVVETFSGSDTGSIEFKGAFAKIKEEYERMQEFTNSYFPETTQTYKRRTERPKEFSKVETISDLPVFETKPNYFLWASFIVIAFLGASMIYTKYSDAQKVQAFQEMSGIQVDILKYRRFGTEIELTFLSKDWNELTDNHKADMFEKLGKFMQDDALAKTSVLVDDNHKVLRILYKDKLPTTVFRTPTTPKKGI